MSLSEKEALLYLSQAAPRGQVRRWLKTEGSPNAAYARHGRNPLWTVSRLADFGIEVVTEATGTVEEVLAAYLRGEHRGVMPCAGGHGDGCSELSHEA